MRIVSIPEALEALPDGSLIKEGSMVALKIYGAWKYEHDGKFWEPQHFPVVLVREGSK